METISMILLMVVLLAQTVLFVLLFREKRRSNRRYNATLNYIDQEIEDKISNSEDSIGDLLSALDKKINEQFKSRDERAERQRTEILQAVQNVLAEQDNRVSERMKDLLLDYSQAQEAANRINDFGASLANIFDYDPLRAIQKGRKKEVG